MQHLPDDLFNAALGYQNISSPDVLSKIWPVGTGSNPGPSACLAACKAKNITQPTGSCGPPMPGPSAYGEVEYQYVTGDVPEGDIL